WHYINSISIYIVIFFFQAEDGIRDRNVTGVQTCALPISKKLNIDATIVVPEDANPSKTSAIHAYGGKVERCGTTSQERLPYAMELTRQKKGVYIPPYDDPMI